MSNTCSAHAAAAGPLAGPAGEPDATDLSALVDHVTQAERHIARAVSLAGRLAGSGVCERVEGLPLDHFLGLAARLTGADRRMLVAAGEALADLPFTAALFDEGKISWGQVRAIVGGVKRLRRADRAGLDARIAATVAERGGLDGFDPDQLLWAVDDAIDDLRDPRSVDRAEARQVEQSFLAVQGRLDGGVALYGQLDPITGAGVLNALDTAAGSPTSDAGPADSAGAAGDTPPGVDGSPAAGDEERWGTARGRQYAAALGRICAEWLGGGTNRPARPLFVSHVQTRDANVRPSGTVELAVRGPLARLHAATLERLATDADLRTVLFDGAQPLAVSDKVNLSTVPADIRFAVGARDQGCRFPGSQDPLAHTDIHHLVPRARGGTHHPDNLARISRRYHTVIHRHDWVLTLDPSSGQITARRGQRAWHSLPRATRLSPAPDRHDLASAGEDQGRAPPSGLPF
jgi:hypothetical protein